MIRLCNGKLCLRVVIKDLQNQKCGLRVKQWLQFRTFKKLELKSLRKKISMQKLKSVRKKISMQETIRRDNYAGMSRE